MRYSLLSDELRAEPLENVTLKRKFTINIITIGAISIQDKESQILFLN